MIRKLAIPLFFALAAVALTWPLAWSPGVSISVRDDYYLSLWNIWWFKTSLLDAGTSLLWTDYLHTPLGVSLTRNVLSPVNAFTGALLCKILDLQTTVEWLHLIHFWLSGWFCFLFVRSITGSTRGSVLAGLFYAFSPFSFYYLPQMDVSTMEFLPLAGFFLVRTYQVGGIRNYLGVPLSALLIAASSLYYIVYIALFGLLLLTCGKVWEPDRPFTAGCKRLALAAFLALCVVTITLWPLISESIKAGMDPVSFDLAVHQLKRSNDLLGFRWVGGPEHVILSWPTLLGYTSLLIMIAGMRLELKRLFWLAAALSFTVLSFGPLLHVGGKSTDIHLPYAWFSEIPVLWMLRKPDRLVVMVLLCFSVFLAWSFASMEARFSLRASRTKIWGLCCLILIAERISFPLATFSDPVPPYLEKLAQDQSVHSIIDIPHMGGHASDARSNYLQTAHHKKIPQGYVVDLALTEDHFTAGAPWMQAQEKLVEGDAKPLVSLAREKEIDHILLRKVIWMPRTPTLVEGEIVWAPFAFRHNDLVPIRQRGAYFFSKMPEDILIIQKETFSALLGPPVFEDDSIMLFDCR